MVEITTASRLDPATADAVRALGEAARARDGVEALGEQTILSLAGDAAVRHVLAHDGGTIVGYAQVDLGAAPDAPASAELVVAPDRRRAGTGSRLLEEVRAVAREADRPGVHVWAHGDLPAAQALARSAGLRVTRELLRLARPLGRLDAPTDDAAGTAGTAGTETTTTAPAGVTVRPFVVGQDEDAWLTVNARAFADHPEQGRMTRADLEAREREPWFDPADLLLAERDGRLVASVWMKIEPGADDGELYVLGVDPDAQGTGLGRYLTARVIEHLAARGLRRVVLYVEGDNVPALRTYERAGFTRDRVDVQYG